MAGRFVVSSPWMVTAPDSWYDNDRLRPLVAVGRLLADVLYLEGDPDRMEPRGALRALAKELAISYQGDREEESEEAVELVLIRLAYEIESDLQNQLIQILADDDRRDEVAVNALSPLILIDELRDVIIALGHQDDGVATTVKSLYDELEHIARQVLKTRLQQVARRWRDSSSLESGRKARLERRRRDRL